MCCCVVFVVVVYFEDGFVGVVCYGVGLFEGDVGLGCVGEGE